MLEPYPSLVKLFAQVHNLSQCDLMDFGFLAQQNTMMLRDFMVQNAKFLLLKLASFRCLVTQESNCRIVGKIA
jgi:hypothetical protein